MNLDVAELLKYLQLYVSNKPGIANAFGNPLRKYILLIQLVSQTQSQLWVAWNWKALGISDNWESTLLNFY